MAGAAVELSEPLPPGSPPPPTGAAPRRVAVVGASGSVGRQTLDVIRRRPGSLQLVALAVNSNERAACEAAVAFQPEAVALADAAAAARVRSHLKDVLPGTVVLEGVAGVRAVAAWPRADITVSAAWGAAGLAATLAALDAGHDVALANKESLVAAGPLVLEAARRQGARLLPVDSEHAAAWQLLEGRRGELERLWITASGGPFRGWSAERVARATPEEALRHPTWRMGARITVDSATLFNKGLEVIEAHWLFGLDFDRIQVVVHPQSVVHALAEMRDGTFLAHAGAADMRLPIQFALAYPDRWTPPLRPLSPPEWGTLSFEEPDRRVFPALKLSEDAGRRGGTAPAVLNAAKEEAVLAFLDRRLGLAQIAEIAADVLDMANIVPVDSVEVVAGADAWARHAARRRIAARPTTR